MMDALLVLGFLGVLVVFACLLSDTNDPTDGPYAAA